MRNAFHENCSESDRCKIAILKYEQIVIEGNGDNVRSQDAADHMETRSLKRIATFFAGVLALSNTARLIGGGQRAIATYNGILPLAHYLPGIGDALAGLLAPAVAIAIFLRWPARWRLAAIAWNCYGALDLIVAIPVNVLYPPSDPRFYTPGLALTFLSFHIVSLVLLFASGRSDDR